jgi:hypothetical protein
MVEFHSTLISKGIDIDKHIITNHIHLDSHSISDSVARIFDLTGHLPLTAYLTVDAAAKPTQDFNGRFF